MTELSSLFRIADHLALKMHLCGPHPLKSLIFFTFSLEFLIKNLFKSYSRHACWKINHDCKGEMHEMYSNNLFFFKIKFICYV